MRNHVVIIFVALIFVAPAVSNAAVLFSENYDNIADWNCSMAFPPGWNTRDTCGDSETVGGVTHYYAEITSGGRAGKSFKQWRHNMGSTDYRGAIGHQLSTAEFANHYKALYVRYYIKFDVGFNSVGGFKAGGRFLIGTAPGVYGNEFLVHFGAADGVTPLGSGPIIFYNPKVGPNYYSYHTMTQLGLLDGNWHCFEFYFKMNSATGVADGGLRFWIDAVEKPFNVNGSPVIGITSRDWGYPTDQYIYLFVVPGIGNLFHGSRLGRWNFPTNAWYKVEFDDYVVSTSYIGSASPESPALLPPKDTAPPAPPQGLKLQ